MRTPSPAILTCVVTLMSSAACSNLTRVTNNTVTQPTQFDNPAGALSRRAGAIRDFARNFSFEIVPVGLLTDELGDVEAGGSSNTSIDRRALVAVAAGNSNTVDGYSSFSASRFEALRAIRTLQQYNPTPKSRIAELYAYIGFTELLFAEDLCSGVPLAADVNDQPVSAGTFTRSPMIALAITHFDSAASNATDAAGHTDSITASLAAIGRGRALIDSGDFAGAATAVATVAATYTYSPPYDGDNQANFAAQTFLSGSGAIPITVSDIEGGNGLDYVSAHDPRVPIDSGEMAGNGQTAYRFVPYLSPAAPIVLASGTEARLIAAEAALPVHGGAGTAWLDQLNMLRTMLPGLAPLADPGTDSARVDLVFRERAFWLFLTGHRQGDLRRLIRQYGRTADAVFPSGGYHGPGGGSYGTDVTFEPSGELNNRTYHGCVNRAA